MPVMRHAALAEFCWDFPGRGQYFVSLGVCPDSAGNWASSGILPVRRCQNLSGRRFDLPASEFTNGQHARSRVIFSNDLANSLI
jgi:hypothetical protein